MKRMVKTYQHIRWVVLFLCIVTAVQAVAAQQEVAIKGFVQDSLSGDFLAGVSIQSGNKVVLSDKHGFFSIRLVLPATLSVHALGYTTLDREVTGEGQLNMLLTRVNQSLGEVVVVGYGKQKKTSLTAAVSTMKGKELTSIPTTNLSNNLGGRLSGVIVKQTTGEPGNDGSNIYIRGIATTGGSQPLLIVDGIPRSFQKLDPNIIESFTVLKDAAAVAPYGVAGANGVILVTTKRGAKNKPAFNYNGYVGFQNPTVLPDLVNGYQYALLRNLAAENEGNPRPYTDAGLKKFKDGSDPDAYPPNSPYVGLVTHNALLQSHSFDISGGSEHAKYYAAFGYQRQQGMWVTANSDRFNLALNLDVNLTTTTTASFNLNGNIQRFKAPPSDLYDWGTLRIFELIKYSHPGGGGPNFFSNGMYGSYASAAIFGSGYNKTSNNNLFTQFSLQQKIPFIPGLNLKGTIAYDPSLTDNKIWLTPLHKAFLDKTTDPPVIRDGIFGAVKPSLMQTIYQASQITFQGSLNYAQRFWKSNISAVGVMETRANNASNLGASRKNYSLLIDEMNMGSSSNADMMTSGSSSAARQVGLVYRVTYDFDGRYFLETSGRYDGHYYFAPDKRFGFFPAFSAGWRMSEERFIKEGLPWVSNLKLRASYGEVGALAGSPFQYLGTYSVSGPGYVFGGNGVQIVSERSEPNPNITWERARKTDLGLELSLFKNLIELEADYFYEKRSNMLVSPTAIVPSEYGIGLSQINAGIMQNQGIEFTTRFNYDVNQDVHVGLGGTFTYAHNKLLQVFETAATYDNPNRRMTGRPLGTQFGYEAIGYFQEADFDVQGNLKPGIAEQPWGQVKPGDLRYQDVNGDGKIDVNDLVPIGNPSVPQMIYGITPSIRYKWISLDLLFQGTAKGSYYFQKEAVWPFWNGMTAMTDNFDYWRPDNTDAANPRLTSAPTTNNTQVSSKWMKDISYLRLKNATLAFNFPESWYSQIKLSNAQLYVAAQNLFTWTKVRNIDPEIAYDRGNTYPQQKVISVGVRLGF